MNNRKKWNKVKFEKSPYKLPEGYFDTCAKNIMARISKEEHRKKRIRWYGICASAAVACFLLAIYIIPPLEEIKPIAQEQENKIVPDNLADYTAENTYDLLMLDANKIYAYEMEED